MVRVKGILLKLKLDRIAAVHLGNIAKANKVAESCTLTLRSKFYNYFTNSKSSSPSSNKRLSAKNISCKSRTFDLRTASLNVNNVVQQTPHLFLVILNKSTFTLK